MSLAKEEIHGSESPDRDASKVEEKLGQPKLDPGRFQVDNIPYLHRRVRNLRTKDEAYCAQNNIEIRIGKWSSEENNLIERNFQSYCAQHKDKNGDWLLGFGLKVKEADRCLRFLKETYFFQRLAHGMPSRPAFHVYTHARKILHSKRHLKKLYGPKDVQQLKNLQKDFSNDFVTIRQHFDRDPASIGAAKIKFYEQKFMQVGPSGTTGKRRKVADGDDVGGKRKKKCFEEDLEDFEEGAIINTAEGAQKKEHDSSLKEELSSAVSKCSAVMEEVLKTKGENNEIKLFILKKWVIKLLNGRGVKQIKEILNEMDLALAENTDKFIVNGKFVRLVVHNNDESVENKEEDQQPHTSLVDLEEQSADDNNNDSDTFTKIKEMFDAEMSPFCEEIDKLMSVIEEILKTKAKNNRMKLRKLKIWVVKSLNVEDSDEIEKINDEIDLILAKNVDKFIVDGKFVLLTTTFNNNNGLNEESNKDQPHLSFSICSDWEDDNDNNNYSNKIKEIIDMLDTEMLSLIKTDKLMSVMEEVLKTKGKNNRMKLRKLKFWVVKSLNVEDLDEEIKRIDNEIDSALAKNVDKFIVDGKYVNLNILNNNGSIESSKDQPQLSPSICLERENNDNNNNNNNKIKEIVETATLSVSKTDKVRMVMEEILATKVDNNQIKLSKLKKRVVKSLNVEDLEQIEKIHKKIESELAKSTDKFIIEGKYVRYGVPEKIIEDQPHTLSAEMYPSSKKFNTKEIMSSVSKSSKLTSVMKNVLKIHGKIENNWMKRRKLKHRVVEQLNIDSVEEIQKIYEKIDTKLDKHTDKFTVDGKFVYLTRKMIDG